MLTPKHTIWDESQMPYKNSEILEQKNNIELFFTILTNEGV